MTNAIRQYLIVTGNYWAFTLSDGALRMLVVLHFHTLGYSPLSIALLFLFYEFFGVVTNLVGGWLGARIGLNRTMNIGLATQVIALMMLAVPAAQLTVPWVMLAQALSGIAKDLNKMSAKSAVKTLLPSDAQGALSQGSLYQGSLSQGKLYRWVARLTGSKNAMKGVGFFLGGLLLSLLGFKGAVLAMAAVLALIWLGSLVLLQKDLGKAKNKPKFRDIFSKSRSVNILSAARLFLFGARDVWFVVALPVYLATTLQWSDNAIGTFLAAWIIAYGVVQALAPAITGSKLSGDKSDAVPDGRAAFWWTLLLAYIPAAIALALLQQLPAQMVLVGGLLLFGAVFAINSSLHSYLIVSYASDDAVSLDVGFYYMSNALGRLLGTVLSGWVFQRYGFEACLWFSSAFVAAAAVISLALPRHVRAA